MLIKKIKTDNTAVDLPECLYFYCEEDACNPDVVTKSTDTLITMIKTLKGDLFDCRQDLCRLCMRQKIFSNEWCKECRWHNE